MKLINGLACAGLLASLALPAMASNTQMLRMEHGWRHELARVSYFDSEEYPVRHCVGMHRRGGEHHKHCVRPTAKDRGGLGDPGGHGGNGRGPI